MKNITLIKIIFVAMFFPLSVMSQVIDFQKRSIVSVVEYEQNISSFLVDSVDNFGILKKPHLNAKKLIQTKALIFNRSEDDFNPQLHVCYYYDHKKSDNKGIHYNWGLYNPSYNPSADRERIDMLLTEEQKFRKKFNELNSQLVKALGEPIKNNTIADNDYNYLHEIFWEDDDKIVGLSINFSRKLNEIPGIGIFANFHIQVMITFKN